LNVAAFTPRVGGGGAVVILCLMRGMRVCPENLEPKTLLSAGSLATYDAPIPI
jgi:hypothetical protein